MGWCGRLISLVQAKIVGLVGPCGVSWPRCVCAAHLLISATRYARTSNQGELAQKGNGSPRQTKSRFMYATCHMPHDGGWNSKRLHSKWVKVKSEVFSREREMRSDEKVFPAWLILTLTWFLCSNNNRHEQQQQPQQRTCAFTYIISHYDNDD